jgi:hypothetical protein
MRNVIDYLQGLPPAQQRQLKERVTAGVLAMELCRRCVESPASQTETVPQFRRYLGHAIHALQAVEATLARED